MLFHAPQNPVFFLFLCLEGGIVPKAEEEKGDNAKKTKQNKFLEYLTQYLKEYVICLDSGLPHQ